MEIKWRFGSLTKDLARNFNFIRNILIKCGIGKILCIELILVCGVILFYIIDIKDTNGGVDIVD